MTNVLRAFHWFDATVFFVGVNAGLVGMSVLLWHALRRGAARSRLFEHIRPMTRGDVLLATSATLMNSGVGVLGWWLWQRGVLVVPDRPWPWALIDWLPMLLVMDLGMYLTHRIAHVRPVYDLMHCTHHEHREVNALSLFVLHPLEVMGFGALMLLAIWLVRPSTGGLAMYLTINLLCGTIGHTGLLPRHGGPIRITLNRLIGTSLFHGQHHLDRQYNLGFYTTVWDRLLGTLHPAYDPACQGNTQPERA